MQFILEILIIFFAGFLTDGIWFLYITKTSEKKKFQAATYSVLTGITAFIWLEGMMQNKLLIIFWLCGLWVGTYYADKTENIIKKIFRIK